MRSQLSVLLSMWHDAVTRLYESREKIDHRLNMLDVMRIKETAIERPTTHTAGR